MRYSGLQPQYFPRLHYFARILNADIFMIRDDVQFVKKHAYPDGTIGKSYQADTPIKQASGMQLLSVPTRHDGYKSIKDTKISYDVAWANSHIKTLQIAYARAKSFHSVLPQIEMLLLQKFTFLAQLNIATILWGIMLLLGEASIPIEALTIAFVNTKLKEQTKFRLKEIKLGSESEVLINQSLDRNEKILALMQEVGADEDYCGGTALNAYMDLEAFKNQGMTITIQDWKCLQYPQVFENKQGFVPDLSILDFVFNVPPEQRAEIIKKGIHI